MSTLNFNEAGEQRNFDLIPDRTVAAVHLTVRRGGAGEDGSLKRSKEGTSESLDCEFVILDGPYAKRKLWERMLISGNTTGHQTAADITKRKLRAIIESARGVKPDDQSETAVRARQMTNYGDFDQLCFIVRVGVEPARGNYKAKNTVMEIITPNRSEWRQLEQVTVKPADHPTVTTGVAVQRPAWAAA
jgi:hypothetical protein